MWPQAPTHHLWVSGTPVYKKRLASDLWLSRFGYQQKPAMSNASLIQEVKWIQNAATADVGPGGRRAHAVRWVQAEPLQNLFTPDLSSETGNVGISPFDRKEAESSGKGTSSLPRCRQRVSRLQPTYPRRRRRTAVTGHRQAGGDVSFPLPNTIWGPAPIFQATDTSPLSAFNASAGSQA